MNITPAFASEFVEEWLQAWNSHDLERLMSHYSPEVKFYSPLIVQMGFGQDGMIADLSELRSYFASGLARYPDLHFEYRDVLLGVDSIVIYYQSVKNIRSAEWIQFGANGKIIQVRAHYGLE
jgi:hypothetical protein